MFDASFFQSVGPYMVPYEMPVKKLAADFDREDRHTNFMNMARAASRRADCRKRQVGALVVKNDRIVSTGRNGSPPGGASCLAGECPRGLTDVPPGSSYDTGPGMCIAVHAEANAIIYAGIRLTEGSTMYVTEEPCMGCLRLIYAARLATVYYLV